jgi:diphthine synthase
MLSFIGVGINGYKSISDHVLEVLNRCKVIYLERFTGFISENDIQELHSLGDRHGCNLTILPVERSFVEEGRAILEQAQISNIALLTYGDPFIATTLIELYVRAIKSGIEVNVIHAASGITSLIGEAGLHLYKFGRTVTIMSEPISSLSVYNTVFENLLCKNHTLILTEYRKEDSCDPVFLCPNSAFNALLQTEEDLGYNAFSKDTFAIVASRIGLPGKKIISGKVRSLIGLPFGRGPHSIIVTGPLHFTEIDALKTVTQNLDEPIDNTGNIQKVSASMIARYVPKAKRALAKMRSVCKLDDPSDLEILDNAACYIDDAERFLRQGKEETAVLSIGYAEGLIDALRFRKGVNPWEL